MIPRGGNYAQLSTDDVLVMWAMISERPINWGYYVIQHMLKAKRKSKSSLPYGMIITTFLQHFKVPLSGELTLVETPHFAINAATLTKMGFKEYSGKWYIPGTSGSHPREDTPPAVTAGATSAPTAQLPPDFMSTIIHEFRDLRTYLGGRLDQLEARMDHVESDVSALRQHFIPVYRASPLHHSPAHFTPTSHASHRPFPTASEDHETLGSYDTIDPADLVLRPTRPLIQLDDSDDSSDDSTDTESDDIADDSDDA